jgi:hypothetical protein
MLIAKENSILKNYGPRISCKYVWLEKCDYETKNLNLIYFHKIIKKSWSKYLESVTIPSFIELSENILKNFPLRLHGTKNRLMKIPRYSSSAASRDPVFLRRQ